MDLGLKGRVALVAASSQGLGKAVALGFAAEGAEVVICSRNQAKLEAARDEIVKATGRDVLALTIDLTSETGIRDLVEQTVSKYKRLDVLINNAGGPPPGFFEDLSDEQWQAGFNLILMSSVRLTRAALPHMKKQKWGRIINITSVSVKQPVDELLLSNSIRLSVIGWAKTLANQVASYGILINNVCPGYTLTDRVTQLVNSRAQKEGKSPEEIAEQITSVIPMKRMGKPEEFANLVVFLASERASYITGTTIQIDGGATRGYQ
jgi:3-oxoacyl-[acyl-carrier protein] reductase